MSAFRSLRTTVKLERVAPAELDGYHRTSCPGFGRPGGIVTENGSSQGIWPVWGEAGRGVASGVQVIAQELQRGRFLGREEGVRVTALRQDHGRRFRQGGRQREDARMEWVVIARGDSHGGSRQCGSVCDRIVGDEVGLRRIGARVGRLRLFVTGPNGRADGSRGGGSGRVLLRQEQRPVAAHGDPHRPDPSAGSRPRCMPWHRGMSSEITMPIGSSSGCGFQYPPHRRP